MKIVFTKGAGKTDRMEIRRPDGAIESIECPKQGIIPHDMVHYAVEHVLGKRGFLRRVQQGENASFRMEADGESDSIERLVEVIQGDGWSGGRTPAAEMTEMYAVTCAARGCVALALDEATIDAIRAEMTGLTQRWQALSVGASLELQL